MKNKIIIIIILVLILLGIISVFVINNRKQSFIEKLNEEYPDSMGKHIALNHAATTVYTQDGGTDTFIACFNGIYYYTGINRGKLFIDNKEIKIDGIIKDMCITTNYTDMALPTYDIGESYEFISIMYVLFNDGRVGKITTEDIKNGNYNITIISEYKNIDCFLETEPVEHGGDMLLWGVAEDGNVYKIDSINVGV